MCDRIRELTLQGSHQPRRVTVSEFLAMSVVFMAYNSCHNNEHNLEEVENWKRGGPGPRFRSRSK